jgi:hypothetical protein
LCRLLPLQFVQNHQRRRIPVSSTQRGTAACTRVVVGGSAGTKRKAAAILSATSSAKRHLVLPPLRGRSSSVCSHPSWGVVERKAKRGRALGRLVPQEEMELDTVVSGSAGKRRTEER